MNDTVFEKMLREHEGVMYRIAYLYVKNRADALDVTQEAACRAYWKIGSLRDMRYVRTWLVRITMNCAVDLLRRQGREKACAPEVLENIGPVSEGDELDVLERVSLEGLMEVLNADEKRVLLLRFYCGCTFAELADEMSVPLGTAKTLVYRALGKLKKRAMEDKQHD